MRLRSTHLLWLAAAALCTCAIGTCAVGGPASPRAALELSRSDLLFLDRVSWGATPSSAAALQREGRVRWLDEQLHAPLRDREPPQAAVAIAAAPLDPAASLAREATMAAQIRAANQLADPDAKKAAQQSYQQQMNAFARRAADRDILRDLYSADQVRERMTWFWFNHFNVHQYKADVRATVGDYVERAIRPHALGRFRDLLEATLRSPAMLRYLDNAENRAGHLNENYAREIMELHTMGVGSGYTQQDVEELARILTGVGVDLQPDNPKLGPARAAQLLRDGAFEFNPARHDDGPKTFLGRAIAAKGFGEVEEALDRLARQPATAQHIARELAIYFVSDAPDDALTARLAQTFLQTDGDIAATLSTLFRSPEFEASLGKKLKDPMQFVLSSVRLAYDDKVVRDPAPIHAWLKRLAEAPYDHETPDGYPLSSAAWSGPGQLAVRFDIARQIGSSAAGLFGPRRPDGGMDDPAFPHIENALYYGAWENTLGEPTRTALEQASSQQEWNALFLSSPEFMR